MITPLSSLTWIGRLCILLLHRTGLTKRSDRRLLASSEQKTSSKSRYASHPLSKAIDIYSRSNSSSRAIARPLARFPLSLLSASCPMSTSPTATTTGATKQPCSNTSLRSSCHTPSDVSNFITSRARGRTHHPRVGCVGYLQERGVPHVPSK